MDTTHSKPSFNQKSAPIIDGVTDIEQIKACVRHMFAESLDKDIAEIDDEAHFLNELGGSSLDYYQVLSMAEEQFHITLEFETENFTYSVNDLASVIKEKIQHVL